MKEVITYNQCPICESTYINKALIAKDYTVSKQSFEIWHCDNCTARFTQHVPSIEQIGKYYKSANYVSHSDTKQGFVNRLYHAVRNYTLSSKKQLIQKYSSVKKGMLLDVGAGTGVFAKYMQQHGWQVTALEPDETARKNAQKNHGILLRPSDEIFNLATNSFDVITLWHVLEHVHQLHEYINTFYKLLKQNGTLIIALPNYTSLDAQHYKQYWAAYDVPRHLYHFSPKSMKILTQQHGFKIIAYKPMWFDSFYVSMLSEQYSTGKTNYLKAFYEGISSNAESVQDAKNCSSVMYVVRKANER